MNYFKSKEHNLIYINCSQLIHKIYDSILELNLDLETIKEKDLKKLIFHYFVEQLLKIGKSKKYTERPVYFIFKDDFIKYNSTFLNCFTYVFKHLKTLLPVPLILIENSQIFINNNGELKGLSERALNYYIRGKISTYKLRKYLEDENFYELVNVLKDVKNIKALLSK